MPSPRAGIVTVGDELLSGRTVDTNAAWLGRRLGEAGIDVVRRWTVGDEEPDIAHAVEAAAALVDLVIVTGGLGPTPDDVTRDAVAGLVGSAAQLGERARQLRNPHGTAPGLVLEFSEAVVVLLPGVPREMRGIVDSGLLPWLVRRWTGRLRPLHVRDIRTTGIPESQLAKKIADLLPEGLDPVRLAFLPDRRGVDLRLSVRGSSAAKAARLFDSAEERLGSVVAPWRYESASGDLAEAVLDALRNAGLTLAVAESCTGGLVMKRLTDVAGASDVFAGGVVAYADRFKVAWAQVPDALLEKHGAVSEPVAAALATGIARRAGADAGVGVTGVAGPSGGSARKPVGTVCYATALGDSVETHTARFSGDREDVRERAAQAVLAQLLRHAGGGSDPLA